MKNREKSVSYERLAIGSGKKVPKGFTGVDLYAGEAHIKADLKTWDDPPSGQTEEVRAIHFLEHLSREECVDLCRRVFRWLAPSGLFVIEMPCRAKCIELLKHYDQQVRWEGAKGLTGGTGRGDEAKKALNKWLYANVAQPGKATTNPIREMAEQEAFPLSVPADIFSAGELHQFVWATDELCAVLQGIGFKTQVESPQEHGKRDSRDMRIVATKPENQ